MQDDTWLAVLARICPHSPVDLDQPVVTTSPARVPVPPHATYGENPCPPVSVALWDRTEPQTPFIGVRVLERVPNAPILAARLASAALERGVVPVILTTLDSTGLEHFGFRIERLPTADAARQAEAEAELAQFWNLAIIIDVNDAVLLG